VVSRRHRPQEERGSALAAADDLPSRAASTRNDIGAIRIMDTTTEFEISKEAAASFAAMIRRPDKEDNIRIEALAEAPQGQGPSEKRSYPPRREAGTRRGAAPRHNDGPRHERGTKPHGKPQGEGGPGFGRGVGFREEKEVCAQAGPRRAHRRTRLLRNPGFGKKKKEEIPRARLDDGLTSGFDVLTDRGSLNAKHEDQPSPLVLCPDRRRVSAP